MQTTTEAVSNVVYREQLDIARQQMLEGAGFTQPLIETELFPGAARQMFKVGEETGTLDQQLEVAAEYFNRELEYRIKTFTTLFEPIMIIFVGVVVGFVAIALVSAMYGVLGGVKEAQRACDQRCQIRSTNSWPTKIASTVPAARNGPNGSAVLRPALLVAIITTPTTAPIRNPKNRPTGTIARLM